METFTKKYAVPAMLLFSVGLMGCSSQMFSRTDVGRTPIAPVLPVATSSNMDPCSEAFQALQEAFRRVTPDRVDDNSVNVWPADRLGKATHPRIREWQGRKDVSWREVASFIRFHCPEYEVRSFASDKDSKFYDGGVIVEKLAQGFSLPRIDLTGAGNTIIIAILLGIGALGGLGMRKALA